ncbi:murein biosynthesis integral membrane protein MurJ [Microlunatus ginsengisoli]|uniref:Lipid II flippase MurJ n=1 Tax=Microlunatus ginsengisoli TaxID=363863 RepID=A0ABP6ZAM8_9ACTN
MSAEDADDGGPRAEAAERVGRTFGGVAAGIAALTLSARVIGFGRSLVFSKTVGDTCLGDAYNAANTLPNVLFEIVAGGVLAGVVVPVIARHVGAGRREESSATVSALLSWTLLVLTVPTLLALAGTRLYAQAFAKPECPSSAATIAALLIMFVPQIWLYGLAVVSAGVLQAHHRFLAAAAAPLVSSLVVIIAYVIFWLTAGSDAGADLTALSRKSLLVLGIGTTLGVLALAATSVIGMAGLDLRLRPRLRFAGDDRSVIIRIAGAGGVGLIIQQISILVVSWAAQQTPDPGALTRYTWANAIYLLPYAVLAAPLLQMIFPRMSAAAEHGDEPVTAILRGAAGPITVLACLGAGLLVATAVPVARVFVLGPGSGDTAALARPIIAFAPAVIGFSLMGLATRTLLARHRARDAGITTGLAWSAVIVLVLAARALPAGWVVTGLAGATSLAMIIGAVTGWLLLARAGVRPGLRRALLVGIGAAAVAGFAVGGAATAFAGVGLVAAVLGSVGTALAATAVFAGLVWVLDRRLLGEVVRVVRPSTASEGRGHGDD